MTLAEAQGRNGSTLAFGDKVTEFTSCSVNYRTDEASDED